MSDLIRVNFTGATNYSSYSGGDVVGCPIDHCWGPVNTLQVLTKAQFLKYYPESKPLGSVGVPYLYPWACAKRALDGGAGNIEVVRPQGDHTYAHFNITAGTETNGVIPATMALARSTTQYDTTPTICIGLKYPGIVPQTLFDYDDFKLNVIFNQTDTDGTAIPIEVQVIGVNNSLGTTTVVEDFKGGFNPTQTVDGVNFYIDNVINNNSDFLDCLTNSFTTAATITQASTTPLVGLLSTIPYVHVALTAANIVAAFNTYYSDREASASSILIPSFSDATVMAAIQTIAQSRMDLIAAVGFLYTTGLTTTLIATQQKALVADKFSVFIAGREVCTYINNTVYMDCTAGWAGATVAVAQSVNTNQPASAKTYGTYSGTLVASLSSSEARALNASGVISIYNSINGPCIFGVRTLHPRSRSYWALLNVMRVTAEILKPVFSYVMDAMHTDVASNSAARKSFVSKLQTIYEAEIAAGNLKSSSTADCPDSLNNDTNNEGGKYLYITLTNYYYKVTEGVVINIVATDSSVQVTTSSTNA